MDGDVSEKTLSSTDEAAETPKIAGKNAVNAGMARIKPEYVSFIIVYVCDKMCRKFILAKYCYLSTILISWRFVIA